MFHEVGVVAAGGASLSVNAYLDAAARDRAGELVRLVLEGLKGAIAKARAGTNADADAGPVAHAYFRELLSALGEEVQESSKPIRLASPTCTSRP
mmetsp:Transcript_9120/g.26629  ORF Transcript_9120/g.26629 Transcript_9120/m.26629 type:complete len:95 (+) Transcript_9120:434-718(+)